MQGFWEARRFHSEHEGQGLGACLLLFGCRSSDTDLLFKQELAHAVVSGSLTRVLPAYSREPGVPKTYVQVSTGGGQYTCAVCSAWCHPLRILSLCLQSCAAGKMRQDHCGCWTFVFAGLRYVTAWLGCFNWLKRHGCCNKAINATVLLLD